MARLDTDDPEQHQIRRLSAVILAGAFPDSTPRWWADQLRLLAREGIVTKRGRWYWGRLDDVGAWLTHGGTWPRRRGGGR